MPFPHPLVPCECLFSAGSKIATDQCSHLGSEKFEQLQVLRHTWHCRIVDQANLNSGNVEIDMEEFQELLQQDGDLVELQHVDKVIL